MKAMLGKCALCAVTAAIAAGDLFAKTETWGDEQYRPKLFKRFGDIVNVPDGLTKDPQGNIYHSAPNLVKPEYPGVIVKRDFRSGRWSVLCAGLRSPKTGFGRPMGLEFCEEDGNLYYCDNQYFDSKDYASRVMRVVLDKKGEVQRIETAVDNVKLANAIRFYKGDMFITDTYFDLDRKDGIGVGGVYRIPLAACKNKTVSLLPKKDYMKDPYFLCATETKPLDRKDESGADGLAITKEGHLYFGTFGSGRFYTAKRKADGSYEPAKLIFEDPKRFPCCDGICYDEAANRIIMSDSCLNALHTWDIAKEQKGECGFGELWRNGDDTGAHGLLDQPCEPMIWKDKKGNRKLIIANFDMTFPGLTNRKNDKFHTLSVINLD
jgi:sugar lactone lactonase YvrE